MADGILPAHAKRLGINSYGSPTPRGKLPCTPTEPILQFNFNHGRFVRVAPLDVCLAKFIFKIFILTSTE